MIDTAHAVIVDVEATPARMAQEIKASKTMLDRIEERHGIKPNVLAADKGYGTGPFLAWLEEKKVTAHIPVLDRQRQSDGLPRLIDLQILVRRQRLDHCSCQGSVFFSVPKKGQDLLLRGADIFCLVRCGWN